MQSGDVLYIKVADLLPKITLLGLSLDEALNLQKEHEELLRQVQVKTYKITSFKSKILCGPWCGQKVDDFYRSMKTAEYAIND